MTAEEQAIKAGLIAGFVDEAHGIVEPEQGYDEDDVYRRAVEYGRRLYRMAFGSVMVGPS
jgi:hypothetical protein